MWTARPQVIIALTAERPPQLYVREPCPSLQPLATGDPDGALGRRRDGRAVIVKAILATVA